MKRLFSFILFLYLSFSLSAFDSGVILGLKAFFSGSKTSPHISSSDLSKMGASFLNGNVGFVMSGELDITYVFDSKNYFKMQNNNIFGGLGLQFFVGVGQGFSGQVSGMDKMSVFVNVYYKPVATFGVGLKGYFLYNRLILGLSLGSRVIADPKPSYDMYNNAGLKEMDGFGTMIVTDEMVKKMNAFGFLSKLNIEYIQPILETTELTLGAYISYIVYKPKYVTMPAVLADAAKQATGFDAMSTPMKSFYLNSLDFGISLGLNFKVDL